MPEILKYDVAIIGGGLTGLWAAKLLQEKNINLVVLEANEYLGGRIYSDKFKDGVYAELGGAYFNNHFHSLKSALNSYDLSWIDKSSTVGNEKNFNEVYFFDDDFKERKIANEFSLTKFVNPSYLPEWKKFVKELEAVADLIRINQKPWNVPDADNLDHCTMEEFIQTHLKDFKLIKAAKSMVAMNACSDSSQMSVLGFAFLVKSWGGVDNLIGMQTTNENLFLPEKGMATLIDRISSQIPNIKTNSPVVGVEHTADKIILKLKDETLVQAKKLLFAMPITMISKIPFTPPVPFLHAGGEFLPMGSCIRFAFRYDNAFWVEKRFSASLIFQNDSGVLFSTDASDYRKKVYIINVCAVSYLADRLSKLSEADQVHYVINALATATNDPKFVNYKEYKTMDWCRSPYIRGGYNSFFKPGFLTSRLIDLELPKNMFMGTSELMDSFQSCLEGSMETAQKVAHDVLVSLDSTTPVRREPVITQVRESSSLRSRNHWATIRRNLYRYSTVVVIILVFYQVVRPRR